MRLTGPEKKFLKAVRVIERTGENFMYAGVSAHSGLRYDDELFAIEDSLLRKGALHPKLTNRGREGLARAA